MYFVNYVVYLVLFTCILWCKNCSTFSNKPIDHDPAVREKYAQFHCFKLRTCTPGGEKVCGYDDTKAVLADFDDLCTFHKVNCHKKGFFQLIESSVCFGQRQFLNNTGRDYDAFDRNLTSVD